VMFEASQCSRLAIWFIASGASSIRSNCA
jgi:hypothetical protein